MSNEDLTVDELHERLRGKGVGGIWDMKKAELLEVLEDIEAGGDGSGSGRRSSDDGEVEAGEPGDPAGEEMAPGKSTTTRDHDVIRRWAESRDATPSSVPGSRHDGHLGVLRFDFPGYGGQDLEEVSWDDWFETFDARGLEFLYQDRRKDGSPSNFFRLLNPDREDG